MNIRSFMFRSFMYHAGFLNDDGGWDSRPIHEQGDNFKRFAELIIRECDRYVTERYDKDGFTEPWMSPGDLLKHFGVEE